MEIVAHIMQYTSAVPVVSTLHLRNYYNGDYNAYKLIYEDCFSDMRRALGLHPIGNCDCCQALQDKAADIFILETDSKMIGSVAIYRNEIDDLIVARSYQHQGYGKKLLDFAVARMQAAGVDPITLHVADWNQVALGLYLKSGFSIIRTEIVHRDCRQQENSQGEFHY